MAVDLTRQFVERLLARNADADTRLRDPAIRSLLDLPAACGLDVSLSTLPGHSRMQVVSQSPRTRMTATTSTGPL